MSGPDGPLDGAEVEVVGQESGLQFHTITASNGAFVIPALDSGLYTVHITAPGLAAEIRDVKVDAERERALPPVRLKPAGTPEGLSLLGAPAIQTTSTEVGIVIGREELNELPLQERIALFQVGWQAGVASNGRVTPVIQGTRPAWTSLVMDGIDSSYQYDRSAVNWIPAFPMLGQVGEMVITTQNAGAWADPGASQIIMVTPAGGNRYHGSAFWLREPKAWAANGFFQNAFGQARPTWKNNQFGGAVGARTPHSIRRAVG